VNYEGFKERRTLICVEKQEQEVTFCRTLDRIIRGVKPIRGLGFTGFIGRSLHRIRDFRKPFSRKRGGIALETQAALKRETS